MASFDPQTDLPSVKVDYTRSSQSQKADLSVGGLIDSAAQFIDTSVKTGASLFKEAIRNDVTKAVDEIQNMFTGNGPTPGSGQDPSKPLPQDVLSRAQRLQALTDKYASGGLAASHYWALMDAEAKSLRSKYAGHREEIDNIFQDLTGAVPANRLIAEYAHAANKKDAAAAERKHWEDKAFGSPEYTAAAAKGTLGQVSNEQLKSWGSAWQLRKSKNEVLMGELNYAEKQTAVGQKRAVDNVNSLTVDLIQDVWRNGVAATNTDFTKLQKQAEEYQKQGKPIPTELTKALDGLAAAGEAEMTKRFEQFLNTPNLDDGTGRKIRLSNYLTNESLKAVRERFEDTKRSYLAPLRNADFGTLAFNDKLVKLNDGGDLSNLLNEDKYVRGVRSAEKAVGSQIAAQYFYNNPDFTEGMTGFAKRMMASKLTSPTPIEQDHQEVKLQLAAKGKSYDEKTVIRETLKGYVGALKDPKTLPEGRSNIIRKLFSTPDFYQRLETQEDREGVYSLLVNPENTKAVMTYGSEQDKQRYVRWVDTIAGSRIDEPALQIKRVAVDQETNVKIQYDPSTFTFRLGPRPDSVLKPGEFALGRNDKDWAVAKRAVDSLNNTMSGWSHVAKTMGKTPDQINETLRRNMLGEGVDIYNIRFKPKETKANKPMSAGEPPAVDPNKEVDTTK